MDKRYQVFVSSTYADLKEERSRVIQTLMEMDCIPAGMELFPAMDEDQFEFIKKIVDDCDYYILIIGGRYGTTTSDGISYTEKEFDYAINRGLKVIAFLHEKPDHIPVNKAEREPGLAAQLQRFRDKASNNRLVKYWKHASELPGLVSLSLSKTIKTYPSVGWVRGNTSKPTELLEEINALLKLNDDLRTQLADTSTQLANTRSRLARAKEVLHSSSEVCIVAYELHHGVVQLGLDIKSACTQLLRNIVSLTAFYTGLDAWRINANYMVAERRDQLNALEISEVPFCYGDIARYKQFLKLKGYAKPGGVDIRLPIEPIDDHRWQQRTLPGAPEAYLRGEAIVCYTNHVEFSDEVPDNIRDAQLRYLDTLNFDVIVSVPITPNLTRLTSYLPVGVLNIDLDLGDEDPLEHEYLNEPRELEALLKPCVALLADVLLRDIKSQ